MNTVMMERINGSESRIPPGMENIKGSREPRGFCLDNDLQLSHLSHFPRQHHQKLFKPSFCKPITITKLKIANMFVPRLLAVTAFTLGLVQASDLGRACGLKIAPCSEDMTCVPNDADCTNLNTCLGTCQFTNTYPSCGGHRPDPPTCADDKVCLDDPRTPESCGQACDVPGICLPKVKIQCGGFTGKACPEGLFCYDVPDDGCDPENGGADCGGICV